MKKIFSIVALLLLTLTASAQSNYDVRVTLTQSEYDFTGSPITVTTAGIVVEYYLAGSWYTTTEYTVMADDAGENRFETATNAADNYKVGITINSSATPSDIQDKEAFANWKINPKDITSGVTASFVTADDAPNVFFWTGSAIDQSTNLAVKWGTKDLFNGTDYDLTGDVSKTDPNDAYSITITGKNNYTGTLNLTWKLLKSVNTSNIIVEVDPATFVGNTTSPLVPNVKVKDNGTDLTAGTDYDITYKTNDGDPTHPNYVNAKLYDKDIIITGKGKYYDTRYVDFKVNPRSITEAVFTGNEQPWASAGYTTAALKALITGTYGTYNLVQGNSDPKLNDYEVTVAADPTGNDYKDAGTYENVITVKAIESTPGNPHNFYGEMKLDLRLYGPEAVNIADNYTIVSTDVYTGGNLPPTAANTKVYYNSTLLTAGTDYTFAKTGADADYKNVKTYENAVIIKGKGKYYGTVTSSYTITPRSMTDAELQVTVNTPLTYNAAEQNVTVTVKYQHGTDPAITIDAANYDYSPKTVKEVGDYDIVITAKDNSNLVGTITKGLQVIGKDMSTYAAQFTINPDPIPVQILKEGETKVEPVVTITDNDTKEVLVKDTHYELSYAGNTAEGTATLTITGKAPYYTGSIIKNFNVVKEFFEVASISYHATSSTTASVGKTGNALAVPTTATDLEIPATVTHAVTNDVFNVTGVDKGALGSNALTSVTMPAGITEIQAGAFTGASNVAYIDMHTADKYVVGDLSRTATTGSFLGVPKQALVYLNGAMAFGENYVFYNGAVYTCDKFVIYDDLKGDQTKFEDNAVDYKWAMVIPTAFTANTVENRRQLTATKFYTTCLPYKLKMPATLEVYELVASSDNELGFEVTEDAFTLDAYKPCLLKAKASGALLSATNVTVEATPAETEIYKLLGVGPVGDGKAYIYGTMRYMDDDTPHSASSANIYIMQGNGEWGLISSAADDYNDGAGICILPMRSYVKMGSAMAARRLTATYTNGIEELPAAEELNAPVYNLQGVRINRADARGLVIVGGKKVLVK